MPKKPALDHCRCPRTCWKGEPDNSMAKKAQCIYSTDYPHEICLDENGNHFIGTGATAQVVVIR